uniref:cytochrome-c oxidase n=1 Tax=Cladosiphon okamuranus TaxID=309737 RepID=A0A3G5FPR2_9PHAE|nr:cytochrome oxidase subunit II [Cladosiphon okamuranus]AYW52570.1 cytochrome oxidase subunit II [Cladosiphon okamuranus]
MKNKIKIIFKSIPFFFFFLSKLSLTILFVMSGLPTLAYMDASHPWQVGFQDPATPIMEGIILFNGLLMTFMILIACLVGWLLYKSLSLFDESVHVNSTSFTHSTLLEVVWTIVPAVILMIISIPSYNLLYAMDEVIDPSLTIKVVGHQWYWSYECSDFEVSPQVEKENAENLKLFTTAKKKLRNWSDLIECAHTETDLGEKQTQMTAMKELLDFLDKTVLTKISREEIAHINTRLFIIKMLISMNEGRKEFHGPIEEFTSGEFVDILSSVKDELKEGSLIPEQQELIINMLKTFKQYLRITEDLEPGVVDQELMNSLESLKDELKKGSDDESDGGKEPDGGNEPDDESDGGNESDGGKEPDGGNEPDDESDGGNESDGYSSDNRSLVGDLSDNKSLVADLMDFDESLPSWKWCELISAEDKYNLDDANLERALGDFFNSERRCNNAAAVLEDNNIPFVENLKSLVQDNISFKKAEELADLSEDKLIDIQLIEHKLRLTRSERNSLNSEFAWNSTKAGLNFAKYEFKVVSDELKNAELYSRRAHIDLDAANANAGAAEYFQADAARGVTEPEFVRGTWLIHKGFDSWHRFLELALKRVSEGDRLLFLEADEKINGINSILGKAQRNLTPEELARSNSIADNARSQFLAMEREGVPATKEYVRGKVIVDNAKSELKTFQEIADRADIRLNKAQVAYDEAKSILNRAQAKFSAADVVFKNAKAKLTGSALLSEPIANKAKLNAVQLKADNLTKDFEKAIADAKLAKTELLVAEKRLKKVKTNLEATQKVFDNTGLLEIHTVKGKPTKEYYDNYEWEIRREDLAFVEAQLKTDTAELKAAKNRFDVAVKNLNEIGCNMLDAEMIRDKVLIEYIKANNNFDPTLLENTSDSLCDARSPLLKLLYEAALKGYMIDCSSSSKDFVNSCEAWLLKAKADAEKSGSIHRCYKGLTPDELKRLLDFYSKKCLEGANEEYKEADVNFKKTISVLLEAEMLLREAELYLETPKVDLHPYFGELKEMHKTAFDDVVKRKNEYYALKEKFSPLDIKLSPGLLQLKSYKGLLNARSELENAKWVCARIAKTLDLPLSDNIKPFNVQFFHLKSLKSGKPCTDNDNSNLTGTNEEGGSDDDKKKKISYSPTGLKKEILNTFSELLKGINKTESESVLTLLHKSFALMVTEEVEKIQDLKDQISLAKAEISYVLNKADDDEKEVERINFDSYLIGDDDLVIPEASGTGKAGTVFRLLEVDNRLFVPINTHIRVLVTSADVLHSWAVPSLGVKVDACPGRLNQVFLFVKREGVFYGQCSELCGVNHGFMPIVVQAVSQDEYLTWVGKRLCS